MRAHLRYLRYVLRHKWFVLLAGFKVGAPLWRLVIHDWSKFTPAEWGPYARWFYAAPHGHNGERCSGVTEDCSECYADRMDFDRAWLHHQHANPHHWQHWVLREDSGGTKVLAMPEKLAREMVADWMGAGRAITGAWESAEWYARNRESIQLHPYTRRLVERLVTPEDG